MFCEQFFVLSRLAIDAIRSLHPGVVTMALNNALWSQDEEICLSKIPSVSVVFKSNIFVTL